MCQKGDFLNVEYNFKYAYKVLNFFNADRQTDKKDRSLIDPSDLKIITLPFFTNKMVSITTYFIIPQPNMLRVNEFFEQHLQTVLRPSTGFMGVPVFVNYRLSCRLPYEVTLLFSVITVEPEVVNISFCIKEKIR